MRPDQTTIVVIGDITPEAAKQVVEANFGGWTAKGPRPAIDLPPVPLSGPSDGQIHEESEQQNSVMLAETVGDDLTQARLWLVEAARVGLSIGLDILGVSAPEAMIGIVPPPTRPPRQVSHRHDQHREQAKLVGIFCAV